jgi:type II secretory pathway component GspD/PulD (secretin)
VLRSGGAAALLLACGVALGPRALAQNGARRPPALVVTRLAGGGEPPGAPQPSVQPAEQLALLPITRLDDRSPGTDLDGPRRISLSLSRPLPLRDMLWLLVSGTPLSLVMDEAVDGTFSGSLNDLTMRQALEAVLFPRGLDYDGEGTLIRVFPRKASTRLFDVNYLNLRRTSRRGVQSATTAASAPRSAADAATTSESDLFDELSKGVESLLSASGRMHVDRSAGLVQVTDFSDRLAQIGLYIEAVQLRATRQVRIEARVLQVTLSSAAASSIDWQAVASRAGAAVQPAASRGAGLKVSDFGALMKALGEQGTVATIAEPQVVAMNNEPAIMRVGTQGVYFTAASRMEQAGRTERTSVASPILEGLTLTVTAQIAPDGIVQLSVAPSYAEKTGESKAAGGEILPVLHVSEADTLVRVRDGDTIVISGFLRDRVKARQNTGLASFFGAQASETVKSELVILLTPTVVGPGGAAETGR